MPGPGQKKPKIRAKPDSGRPRREDNQENGSVAVSDAYVGAINHAADWMARVEILCRVFDIPGWRPCADNVLSC